MIICIVSKLVRVHDRRGHLDRALKVEVVVALLVRELLNLSPAHACRVHGHAVVHRQRSRHRCVVRHHVEVEVVGSALEAVLHDALVDDGAGGDVHDSLLLDFEEPGVDVLVYEDVEYLWVVGVLVVLY